MNEIIDLLLYEQDVCFYIWFILSLIIGLFIGVTVFVVHFIYEHYEMKDDIEELKAKFMKRTSKK